MGDVGTGRMGSVGTRALHVGVDLDEVCYPFIETVRQLVVEDRGAADLELAQPTGWGIPLREWGFDGASFEAFFVQVIRDGRLFRHGDPIEGAVEGLAALADAGHDIHLVTARRWAPVQAEIEAATREWLDRHGLAHTTLTFDEDKTVVPTDVFLDDAVHNYEALEAAGGFPVLYHQHYNADHGGRRVHSWPEFVDLVEDLAA